MEKKDVKLWRRGDWIVSVALALLSPLLVVSAQPIVEVQNAAGWFLLAVLVLFMLIISMVGLEIERYRAGAT